MQLIKNPLEREIAFYALWEIEVAPYIKKEKYKLLGNDVFIKNFTEEDDDIFNDFLDKYHELFKYPCYKKGIRPKLSKYGEDGVLFKHLFDW